MVVSATTTARGRQVPILATCWRWSILLNDPESFFASRGCGQAVAAGKSMG
jgi:hypothetical protein